MTTNTLTGTSTIPYAKLTLSETNVRKTSGDTGIAALAASIAEHGLIQPLIVSAATPKKTKYAVHAGGRRWRAIGMLIEAGTLPKDYAVEVRIVDSEAAAAREISLAENLLRENMTPADEASAYRDIVASGASAEDVARRFGVTVRHVHGRLRLADLAGPIFAALSDGAITLDVAMAYGSVSDHACQIAAWERLSTSWQGDNPQAIRRAINAESLSASDPVALLVGEADYLAAGGRIERDLFAGEGAGTWLDVALAQNLAMQKLTFEAEVAQLATKLGWVKPLLATRVSYDDTRDLSGYYPDYAQPTGEAADRIVQIEDRIDAIDDAVQDMEDAGIEDDETSAAYDALCDERETLSIELTRIAKASPIVPDEVLPTLGTFMILSPDGKPVLLDSYYAPAKPARSGQGKSSQTDTAEAGQDDAAQGDGVDGNAALPRSLEEQLAKDRRDILALHVAHNPALALDLAIFSLAREHAGHWGYNDTGCSIRITDRAEPAGLKDIPASTAADDVAALRGALPDDWTQDDDSFASFLAFRALDEQTRAAWLAYAVSQSLKASLASGSFANGFQSQLGMMLGIDTCQHWRPGAERFFDRIKKSQILTVLGHIDPAMPGRYATAKKGELASAATKLCAGEAIVEPAIKQRALTWVPDVMAFGDTGHDVSSDIDTDTANDTPDPAITEADDNAEGEAIADEDDVDYDRGAWQAVKADADAAGSDLAQAA